MKTPVRRGAAVVIALWLVFLLACGAIIVRTHFTTDLSAFLPRTPTPEQQLLMDQLRDGLASRLILVGIEGAPNIFEQTKDRREVLVKAIEDDPFLSTELERIEDAKDRKRRVDKWLTSISHAKSHPITCAVIEDEETRRVIEAYDADGVICNALLLHHDVKRFRHLRFVQLTSAGLDRVPVDELAERGVAVFNARGVYSIPLAEWVVMQILQSYKRSRFFARNQGERKWEKARDLREVAGRTACIVGFGDVGQEVAKRLRPFGVRISAVDIRSRKSTLADEVFGFNSLGTALTSADFVVLAVPLTPTTRHLLNGSSIALMKADAVLVNVSRGQVIDEAALVAALNRGQFYGVALDVFEQEPLDTKSELWSFERVVVTPHNSFVSDQTGKRLFQRVLENLPVVESPSSPCATRLSTTASEC